MIRREIAAREGVPAAWVIISQIDHARLAAKLSKHWGGGPFAAIEPREPLQWAIEHHDDGWRDWDRHPGVDASTGVPRQFTEMEPAETLAIWTQSIDAAAAQGLLEGYLVAGHFCRLGRRATAGKDHDASWQPFIQFLDHYERNSQEWLAQWQSQSPEFNTPQRAAKSLDQLQFFDTFSLWFCCSESTDREVVDTPSGTDLTIDPRSGSQIRLSPWPLSVETLELEVTGRLIPADRYTKADDLAAARSQAITLRWKLMPRS